MNGQRLLTVTEEQDLGVVISSDIKSSQQCIQAYSKASRILAMINRTIVYKNSENLIRLYKSLVCPHLEYCTAIISQTKFNYGAVCQHQSFWQLSDRSVQCVLA